MYYMQPLDAKGYEYAGDWHDDLAEAIANAKCAATETGVAAVYVWEGELVGQWEKRVIAGVDPVWQSA
jgi:uncharacterized protein involved in tolerance to divalent cations